MYRERRGKGCVKREMEGRNQRHAFLPPRSGSTIISANSSPSEWMPGTESLPHFPFPLCLGERPANSLSPYMFGGVLMKGSPIEMSSQFHLLPLQNPPPQPSVKTI